MVVKRVDNYFDNENGCTPTKIVRGIKRKVGFL